jgi:hypothetical protein
VFEVIDMRGYARAKQMVEQANLAELPTTPEVRRVLEIESLSGKARGEG